MNQSILFNHYIRIMFLTFFIAFNSWAQDDVPKNAVMIGVQKLKIKNKDYLAINFENYPGWHTYWKNPGDAGLAIKNIFKIKNKEYKFIGEEEWPAPRRFIEEGDMWAYGYQGKYSLFYRLSKKDFNELSGKEIELNSSWLVCKHVCVPGQKIVHFRLTPDNVQLNSDSQATKENILSDEEESTLTARFFELPSSVPIPGYLNIKLYKGNSDKNLLLQYEVAKVVDNKALEGRNLLFPFLQTPFDFKHESLEVLPSSLKGSMDVIWDGEYLSPPQALPKDGKFKKPYKLKFVFIDPILNKYFVIEKTFNQFEFQSTSISTSPTLTLTPTPSTSPADLFPKNVTTENSSAPVRPGTSSNSKTLIYYLLLAFVGGIILNFMPCVLPMISLKLFELIKYKNESRRLIFRHNLFYSLGVIATLFVLATSVLIFKKIGTEVGWGFQLQSPHFIATMILILFVFSLNLFGLFEFRTPGGKWLGNINLENSFIGDFLSGVMATVLSTPCSAPFLGTALTFAFSASVLEIYLTFFFIGLGLSFPFLVTALIPGLVRLIPRPGKWMNQLKFFLGFSLVLTIIWLLDVYNSLVDGSAHITKLTTSMAFIIAGFYLFKKKEKNLAVGALLFSLGLFINLSSTTLISGRDEMTSLIRDKQSKGLNWEPWSEEKMANFKTTREIVFIDFTAKWCFTCKVNEKLVLETQEFKNLVQEKNLKLLIGDWTKRDELIGSFLKKHGLVGVPAYFIQKADGTLINLGETISVSSIRKHL